ncbi:MAG: ABC transporter substrate-binding protein [Chloroflexi bacterium]|nr:ABC transporter substrate-binding protein [Chloroflexota bacterium]
MTPQPQAVRVAFLLPLSGQVPEFGAAARNGAMLALDEWNARGGVLGQPVKAAVEDSQCTAEAAIAIANKVIDRDGVHYIVGELCSSASVPISQKAEAAGVVQISPAALRPELTLNADGTTKSYVFRACFLDRTQGAVMAKFALQQGHQRAFVMLDGSTYAQEMAGGFRDAFEQDGGTVVGWETYAIGATDLTKALDKAVQSQPDVLYTPAYYPDINLVAKQARQLGVTAVLMGADGWDTGALDVQAVDGGFYAVQFAVADPRPMVQTWVASYRAKHGQDPDFAAALTYDATNLLLTAIQQAGVDDPARVKDVLAGIEFEGVSGTWTYDAQHNPIKSVTIMQVKDGERVYVGTITP